MGHIVRASGQCSGQGGDEQERQERLATEKGNMMREALEAWNWLFLQHQKHFSEPLKKAEEGTKWPSWAKIMSSKDVVQISTLSIKEYLQTVLPREEEEGGKSLAAAGHLRMLRCLARRHIGTCAAESFSEGVFRAAKLTMGELRTRLTPENLMHEVIVRMCSDFVWEKREEFANYTKQAIAAVGKGDGARGGQAVIVIGDDDEDCSGSGSHSKK